MSAFKAVGMEGKGTLTIIRPSKLATDGTTGVVVEGVYESATPNKFNADKLDYFIRTESGDLTIINSTGSLARQMGMVAIGELVRITYNGKKELTKGKLAGKSVHDFLVETASDSE